MRAENASELPLESQNCKSIDELIALEQKRLVDLAGPIFDRQGSLNWRPVTPRSRPPEL